MARRPAAGNHFAGVHAGLSRSHHGNPPPVIYGPRCRRARSVQRHMIKRAGGILLSHHSLWERENFIKLRRQDSLSSLPCVLSLPLFLSPPPSSTLHPLAALETWVIRIDLRAWGYWWRRGEEHWGWEDGPDGGGEERRGVEHWG